MSVITRPKTDVVCPFASSPGCDHAKGLPSHRCDAVTLEVPVVDGIDADPCWEQAYIGFGKTFPTEERTVMQPHSSLKFSS